MRILHCFNWKLVDIVSILDEVKNQGFDAIQINPIQPLKEDGIKEWWMSYQPIDFSIGNYFRTKENLIYLCEESNKREIKIFADVVINHTGASVEDDLTPHQRVNPLLKNKDYWRPKIRVSNWGNRYDVIHNCIDLPGLNVYHPFVENMIVKFLNELIDCGINGFRFDAAKSIGLPSEGYRFWPNIIYRLKKYGLFLYGEIIFEEDMKIKDEYALYMHILGNYDCTDPNQMVKYIENHDTFLSDSELGYTKNWPSSLIVDEYSILVRNYENTLFYARPFDDSWKSEKIRNAHILDKEEVKVKILQFIK